MIMASQIPKEYMIGYIHGSSQGKGNLGWYLSKLKHLSYDEIHAWYYKEQKANNKKRKYKQLSLFGKLKYHINKKMNRKSD